MGSGATGSGRGARPKVTRRREVSDASARSLLTTVLGEYVLPHGEPVWTQTIVDVLGRFEIEEKSARQALARVAAEGWLSSERVGRRVRWALRTVRRTSRSLTVCWSIRSIRSPGSSGA